MQDCGAFGGKATAVFIYVPQSNREERGRGRLVKAPVSGEGGDRSLSTGHNRRVRVPDSVSVKPRCALFPVLMPRILRKRAHGPSSFSSRWTRELSSLKVEPVYRRLLAASLKCGHQAANEFCQGRLRFCWCSSRPSEYLVLFRLEFVSIVLCWLCIEKCCTLQQQPVAMLAMQKVH